MKQILHEYSKFLNKLGGTYLTAQDIGISLDDIKLIKKNFMNMYCVMLIQAHILLKESLTLLI